MNKPKISLVIPAFNEENRIRACLESIIKNSDNKNLEIIVVDNGSTDKTFDIAKSFPEIKVIKENQKGVMHARQRGVNESTGDIIAFIDAENLITQNWFKIVIEEFEKDPSLVCLSGPYKYYDLSKSKSLFMDFGWQIVIFTLSKLIGYVGNFGNMILRTETLKKMGGLDTSIAFYGDDTDTAKRASYFGKVKFNRKLIIKSSGRRFESEGLFKTTLIYGWNFFGEVFFSHPMTKEYKDIR